MSSTGANIVEELKKYPDQVGILGTVLDSKIIHLDVLTALAVAKLGQEAGLPDGVISLVKGDADDAPVIGGELTSNPVVRKAGFTGPTEEGAIDRLRKPRPISAMASSGCPAISPHRLKGTSATAA